jgi:predicted nucleotide-binding protein
MMLSTELDIEILDAGVAHALYAASLVNLAISLNRGQADDKGREAVSKYATRLSSALTRCGVDREIPVEFKDAESIMHLLTDGNLMTDIGNLLVRVHGQRQEKLWLVTCLLGGAFTGGEEASDQLRPHLAALGQSLQLPVEVIDACLRDKNLQPLRDWVSEANDLDTEMRMVFIGHGRSPAWRDFKDLISERLGLQYVEFNSVSATGIATKERLEEMLNKSAFAFLVMTGEDSHRDGSRHARENVIHEIGLFQGRLGFKRAIVLLEDGCEEFSNITGIGQIRFPKGNILAKSEEVRMALEREGMLGS